MLEQLKISGVNLPKLYIAKSNADVQLAKENGLPYIVWKRDNNELIKLILRPVLEKLFPHVLWDEVLGKKKRFETNVVIADGGECSAHGKMDEIVCLNELSETADIASEKRSFYGGLEEGEDNYYKKLSLEEYVGDISSSVDLEVLQKLELLPKFMSDIVDCIKTNLCNVKWREGYNKKLGAAIGTFNNTKELPNLIILDISGSIPRGISGTMITLIDTLRNQVKADLIITSDISRYYPFGSKLPDPQEIRNTFGYGNEAYQFYNILDHHISGKEWGHVISFGDNDCPSQFTCCNKKQARDKPFMAGTKIHMVHHYHTISWWGNSKNRTGYAEWCHEVAYLGGEEYDTSWCNVIRK